MARLRDRLNDRDIIAIGIRSIGSNMNIKAVIHPAEEDGYWAEVPALPGCITEGDSMEEVVANLKDAILL